MFYPLLRLFDCGCDADSCMRDVHLLFGCGGPVMHMLQDRQRRFGVARCGGGVQQF
jgi:hypothetical protein